MIWLTFCRSLSPEKDGYSWLWWPFWFWNGRKNFLTFVPKNEIRRSNPRHVISQSIPLFVTSVKMTMIRHVLPLTVHNRLAFVVKSRVGHYPISIWLTEIASVMGVDWISVLQHVCTAHAAMSEHFVFCEAICRPPSEEIRNYDNADLLSLLTAQYKITETVCKVNVTRI